MRRFSAAHSISTATLPSALIAMSPSEVTLAPVSLAFLVRFMFTTLATTFMLLILDVPFMARVNDSPLKFGELKNSESSLRVNDLSVGI